MGFGRWPLRLGLIPGITNFTAVPYRSGLNIGMRLSWDTEPDATSSITGYNVYILNNANPPAPRKIPTAGATAPSTTNKTIDSTQTSANASATTLAVGIQYTYYIAAVTAKGEGLRSMISKFAYNRPGTPVAVTTLVMNPTDEVFLLSYKTSASNNYEILGEKISIYNNSGSILIKTITNNFTEYPENNGTTYNGVETGIRNIGNSDLTKGITYYFQISYFNAVGEDAGNLRMPASGGLTFYGLPSITGSTNTFGANAANVTINLIVTPNGRALQSGSITLTRSNKDGSTTAMTNPAAKVLTTPFSSSTFTGLTQNTYYYYSARVNNGGQSAEYTSDSTGADIITHVKPTEPTITASVVADSKTVTLTWPAITKPTTVTSIDGANINIVGSSTIIGASATSPYVQPNAADFGTSVQFQVKIFYTVTANNATHGNGNTKQYYLNTITTTAVTPYRTPSVSSITAGPPTTGSTTIPLSWIQTVTSSPYIADGATITGYNIYPEIAGTLGSAIVCTQTNSSAVHNFAAADYGKPMRYKISPTYTASGVATAIEGTALFSSTVTPYDKPQMTTVTASISADNQTITLTWSQIASTTATSATITGYRIYDNSTPANVTTISSASTVTTTLTGTYGVSAIYTIFPLFTNPNVSTPSEGRPFTTTSITPYQIPVMNTVTAAVIQNSTTITLSWTAVTSPGATITGYKVYPETGTTALQTLGVVTTTTITGTYGTRVRYKVVPLYTAHNVVTAIEGTSVLSNYATPYETPLITGLTRTVTSNVAEVVLNWYITTKSTSTLQGFRVYDHTTDTLIGTVSVVAGAGPFYMYSYTVRSPAFNIIFSNTYFFKVAALYTSTHITDITEAPRMSVAGFIIYDYANISGTPTITTPLKKQLTVTGGITATKNVSPITGYKVIVYNSSNVEVANATSTSTYLLTIGNLNAGVYTVKVAVGTDGGYSPTLSNASATVNVYDVPSAPIGLTGESLENGFRISWTETIGSINNMLAITGFNITVNNIITNTNYTTINNYTGTSSYTFTNVPNGTYQILVTSINSAGTGTAGQISLVSYSIPFNISLVSMTRNNGNIIFNLTSSLAIINSNRFEILNSSGTVVGSATDSGYTNIPVTVSGLTYNANGYVFSARVVADVYNTKTITSSTLQIGTTTSGVTSYNGVTVTPWELPSVSTLTISNISSKRDILVSWPDLITKGTTVTGFIIYKSENGSSYGAIDGVYVNGNSDLGYDITRRSYTILASAGYITTVNKTYSVILQIMYNAPNGTSGTRDITSNTIYSAPVAPTNFALNIYGTVTGYVDKGFVFKWNRVTNVITDLQNYKVYFSPTTLNTYTGYATTFKNNDLSGTYQNTGLTEGTTYDIYLVAVSDSTKGSAESSPSNILTLTLYKSLSTISINSANLEAINIANGRTGYQLTLRNVLTVKWYYGRDNINLLNIKNCKLFVRSIMSGANLSVYTTFDNPTSPTNVQIFTDYSLGSNVMYYAFVTNDSANKIITIETGKEYGITGSIILTLYNSTDNKAFTKVINSTYN